LYPNKLFVKAIGLLVSIIQISCWGTATQSPAVSESSAGDPGERKSGNFYFRGV
jgi:hypothetical protein